MTPKKDKTKAWLEHQQQQLRKEQEQLEREGRVLPATSTSSASSGSPATPNSDLSSPHSARQNNSTPSITANSEGSSTPMSPPNSSDLKSSSTTLLGPPPPPPQQARTPQTGSSPGGRRRRLRSPSSPGSDGTKSYNEMSVRGLDLLRYARIAADNTYRCIECERVQIHKNFKNKYSFQRHAFLYHEGAARKVFPCPICQKEFSRPDKMKSHLKTAHDCIIPKADAGGSDGNASNRRRRPSGTTTATTASTITTSSSSSTGTSPAAAAVAAAAAAAFSPASLLAVNPFLSNPEGAAVAPNAFLMPAAAANNSTQPPASAQAEDEEDANAPASPPRTSTRSTRRKLSDSRR